MESFLQNNSKTEIAKGSLKIFLGIATGVGKTHKMLQNALNEYSHEKNIIIGFINSQEDAEIRALSKPFEKIDNKSFFYKNMVFNELNLEAIVVKNPKIVLIDDLAYTNIDTSRHKKRYQDILELLNLGINVWTTLNVENIESQSAIVEQITGKIISNTIPDFVIEMAQSIEIVDIPSEELRQKIINGKIFPLDRAYIELNNFYRIGNLNSLRELTFQFVAKLISRNVDNYRNIHKVQNPWKSKDKLLVAVGPSPFSAYLIKWTKKTAFSMNAPWIAVNIENTRNMSYENQKTLNTNINLARQLGAKIITIADDDIVRGIMNIAKEQNISQIVVGKPFSRSFVRNLERSITNRLIKESGDIDIYVVSDPEARKKSKKKKRAFYNFRNILKESLLPLPLFIIIIFLGTLLEPFVSHWGLSLMFISFIIYISSYSRRITAIITSITSALIWNYVFIPPKWGFSFTKSEPIIVYFVFFIISLITTNLTVKLHTKENFLKKREKKLELLYELSQEIINNDNFEKIMLKSIEYIERYFNLKAMLFIHDDTNSSSIIYPSKNLDHKENEIITWVTQNGIPAGRGTDNFFDSNYYFYPILSPHKTEGVIILNVNFQEVEEKEEFLKTVSFMIGSSITKNKIIALNQKIMIEKETEKLYSIILRSISHELKTPITSISLSVSGLKDELLCNDKKTRDILITDILEANERLNRIITNLLDMTRIESGRLKLNFQWNDINDLLSSSVSKYQKELTNFNFHKEIIGIIPPIKLDFGLIEQVISNLLYNAILHTKKDTKIFLRAQLKTDSINIQVIDNGGGVKNIHKIFDKFYKERPEKTGGLGIGLSICKAIVEFHHWELLAYNNDIGGATFEIKIPYKKEVSHETRCIGPNN